MPDGQDAVCGGLGRGGDEGPLSAFVAAAAAEIPTTADTVQCCGRGIARGRRGLFIGRVICSKIASHQNFTQPV